jgi:hypothetical protein
VSGKIAEISVVNFTSFSCGDVPNLKFGVVLFSYVSSIDKCGGGSKTG